MCEHCGCRQMEPIAELMDEHFVLLDLAGSVRRALAAGDRSRAVEVLESLSSRLTQHVRREERGVFAALREQGDFAYAVDELENEHLTFDQRLAAIDPDDAGFAEHLAALLDELKVHIDKENLGVFAVSVVTLGADGWETVSKAHAELPTFLSTPTPT
ncbi:hemerythrin domain-containing protein [Kribbella sp. NPDC050470]|uniref:hemerythrin domain-containing protein n=1 Tax=unclassified Kribbella TaxID=2644121 RepID=UPI00379D8A0C